MLSHFNGRSIWPLLLLGAAGILRGDVTITSGTITSAGGQAPTGSVNLAGPNLSISGNTFAGSLSLLGVGGDFESVTFYPSQNVYLPGSGLPLSLTYNGIAYSFFTAQLNFTAAAVSTPNLNPGPLPFGFYKGNVTNVAFKMTGTIIIYSDFSKQSVVEMIPISGTGIYFANASGEIVPMGPGGIPQGQVVYQFSSPAGFLADTTTQGSWSGSYGGDGYQIAGGNSQPAAYGSVQVTGASTYTWASETSDVRALQSGPGSTGRVASAYYGNDFDIHVNMPDGNLHRVALYLLDWDSTSRAETITISNASTNALIDTETYNNFSTGEYAAWNLQGNVNIHVAATGSGGAVVSGIFLGPSGSVPLTASGTASSAIFQGVDPLPHGGAFIGGGWYFGYGQAGYMIANGPSQAPAYAVASVSGDFAYTWAAQTTDGRALKLSPSSTVGIASAYTQYPGSAFTININVTDGNSHEVALYLLDWDSMVRSETITVRDASTNALLSSETFSGFNAGQYAAWTITGNVTFTVTPNNETTPVVSGIFFN